MRLRTLARRRRLTRLHVASAFLVSVPTRLLLGLATLGVVLSVTSSTAESDLSGLLESERNTIEVFRKAGGSVVFVTNNALQRDVLSTNISEVPQGTGSGFLWDSNGHVVTNYHVVQGGQTFSITLADGTVRAAKLIGALTDHVVRSWGLDGVVIRQVLRGSQAEAAGLLGIRFDRDGNLVSADIIQAIDGDPIHNFADLANSLDSSSPGDVVEVSILRNGQKRVVRVPLARLSH